jgi:co-chaperonin GroES (HSP10)
MRVKPLGDRVLVKRMDYVHPTLAVVGVTLQKGLVVAVGPGRRRKRKVRFDNQMGHMNTSSSLYFEDGDETGEIRPMRVKVGDYVEFSPRNQIEWEFEGEKYVWIKEQACYGTTNDSKAEALLWQQPAGYDRNGNYLPTEGHVRGS